MRFVILLALLGLIGWTGCGPAKNPQKKEPDPKEPVIEPPPPVTPVTPDKNPMPSPMPTPPATPEKKQAGTTEPKTTAKPLSPEELAKLIESLKKADSRDDALAGLKAQGAGVVPNLITALESDKGEARQVLLFALGSFGKDAAAALPALKKLVESEKDPATVVTAQFTIDAIEGN